MTRYYRVRYTLVRHLEKDIVVRDDEDPERVAREVIRNVGPIACRAVTAAFHAAPDEHLLVYVEPVPDDAPLLGRRRDDLSRGW